jgi:lactate permease
LGTDISAFFAPLYLPGAVFVAVVLATIFLHHMRRQQVKTAVSLSARTLAGSAIALGASVPMVRIFINSGVNSAGLDSMPIELANMLAGSRA